MNNVKLTMRDVTGDLKTYFNWSANALMPIYSGGADGFLVANKQAILSVAKKLLKLVNYTPSTVYRGIILKEPVQVIEPHENFQYLSFTDDYSIADHFADVKTGFGSQLFDLKSRLGEHGYIIEYTPKQEEVLFHHRFLSILPYAQGFSAIGIDGQSEVDGLKKQKEVMILQPKEPFTNIKKR